MPTDNAAQIAEWNGSVGRRWVAFQPQLDRMIEPFGEAALRAAAAQPGERVLDIGCGCGSTALALAQAVGPQGSVLGVDISQPMLAVARQRGAAAGMACAVVHRSRRLRQPAAGGPDLLFSRFGVMFFAAPASALRHLRGALRPGGRCAFVLLAHAARQPLGDAAADRRAPGAGHHADAGRSAGAGPLRLCRRPAAACACWPKPASPTSSCSASTQPSTWAHRLAKPPRTACRSARCRAWRAKPGRHTSRRWWPPSSRRLRRTPPRTARSACRVDLGGQRAEYGLRANTRSETMEAESG